MKAPQVTLLLLLLAPLGQAQGNGLSVGVDFAPPFACEEDPIDLTAFVTKPGPGRSGAFTAKLFVGDRLVDEEASAGIAEGDRVELEARIDRAARQTTYRVEVRGASDRSLDTVYGSEIPVRPSGPSFRIEVPDRVEMLASNETALIANVTNSGCGDGIARVAWKEEDGSWSEPDAITIPHGGRANVTSPPRRAPLGGYEASIRVTSPTGEERTASIAVRVTALPEPSSGIDLAVTQNWWKEGQLRISIDNVGRESSPPSQVRFVSYDPPGEAYADVPGLRPHDWADVWVQLPKPMVGRAFVDPYNEVPEPSEDNNAREWFEGDEGPGRDLPSKLIPSPALYGLLGLLLAAVCKRRRAC